MGPNIVDKGKEPDVISLPASNVDPAHVLRYRQLQEEHEAKIRKIIAELEAKQEELQKKLEASFAERERRLTEDFQARHMAECRRLELASADREHILLEKLGVARRLLAVVSLGFLILVVAVLYYRAGLRPSVRVVPPPSKVSSGDTSTEVMAGLLPHLSAPDVSWNKPGLDKDGGTSAGESGNGGVFVRGNM